VESVGLTVNLQRLILLPPQRAAVATSASSAFRCPRADISASNRGWIWWIDSVSYVLTLQREVVFVCYKFTKDNAACAHTSEKPMVPIPALTSCKSVQNTKHPKLYWTTVGIPSTPRFT